MGVPSIRSIATMIPEDRTQKRHVAAIFVNSLGFGMVIPAVTLYFTKVIGLSAAEVGIGFTVSGLVALGAGLVAGKVADRRGPRDIVLVTMVMQGLASFAYLAVDQFLSFVIIATAEMLFTTANMAASGALIRRVGGDDAVTYRSSIRAVSHLGTLLGVAAAAVAIQWGAAGAYRGLLVANGVSFLLAAVLLLGLPRYPALPAPTEQHRWIALRDKPFAVYSFLAGAISIQYFVLDLALPVWVVASTDAPPWSVSLYIALNTLLMVFLQVRVGKGIQTVAEGGRALRLAGVLFLVSLAGIAFATGLPGWAALLLLVAAVVVHSFGEMYFSSGSFALDFGLAPANAQGQYQGLAGIGSGLGSAVAPLVLISWCLEHGTGGWLLVGAVTVLLGLLAPAVAGWGERTRPAVTSATDAVLEPVDVER